MEAILRLDHEIQLDKCRQVLRSVAAGRRPNAHWFRDPVDLEDNPDYKEFVDRPMDFRTISNKLANDDYRDATDFNQDVLQVFRNCYEYNPEDHPAYLAAAELEDVFHKKWLELAPPARVSGIDLRRQNDPVDQTDDDPDETIRPYPTRRSSQQSMGQKRSRSPTLTTQTPPRQIRKCRTTPVDYNLKAATRRQRWKPRAQEQTPAGDEFPSPEEYEDSDHADTNSAIADTPIEDEQLKAGTYVTIDFIVAQLLGVVQQPVAYSSRPEKKDTYKVQLVSDTGPVERFPMLSVEHLLKTPYQMGDEVTMKIKVSANEMRVTTRVEAIKMINEVVHYDVEVQGQVATVTGDALE